MIPLVSVITSFRGWCSAHSPQILMGTGIGCMLASTVSAVALTPKASEAIKSKENTRVNELSPFEMVKVAWKYYIPAATLSVAGIACFIGSGRQSSNRMAALSLAYSGAETALSKYKTSLIKTVGEKRATEVRDSAVSDMLADNPLKSDSIITTKNGNTLCYDSQSGRYFYSDIDHIRSSVNRLNEMYLEKGCACWNDLYYFIGLDPVPIGDHLGWVWNPDTNNRLIFMEYSAQLTPEGEPCIVLLYNLTPKFMQ